MKSNVQEFIKVFINESKNGNLDGKSLNDIISYQGDDVKLIKLKELLKLLEDQQVKTLIGFEKGGVLIEYLEILDEFVSKRKEKGLRQSNLGFQPTTLKRMENLKHNPTSSNLLKMWKFIHTK